MAKNWHDSLWRLFPSELLGKGEQPAGGKPNVVAARRLLRRQAERRLDRDWPRVETAGGRLRRRRRARAKSIVRTEQTASWAKIHSGGQLIADAAEADRRAVARLANRVPRPRPRRCDRVDVGGRRETIWPVKRPVALLFAPCRAGAAVAGIAGRRIRSRARTVRREAARSAEAAGMRAAEALAAHVRELKLEAQNAASNPRLVAALRGNADAATLQDLFRTEDWWEPYRNAFRVYAVAFEGDKLDVIEGMKTAEFASDLHHPRGARAQGGGGRDRDGQGLAVRGGRGAAWSCPGRAIPAVLVLAQADRRHGGPQARREGPRRRAAVGRHARRDRSRRRARAGAAARRGRLRDRGPDLRGQGRDLGGGGQPAGPRAVAVDVRERRRRRARSREHRRRARTRRSGRSPGCSRSRRCSSACGASRRRPPRDRARRPSRAATRRARPGRRPVRHGRLRVQGDARRDWVAARAARRRRSALGRAATEEHQSARAARARRRRQDHQLRPLPAARPAGRRRDGAGLHGGHVRRRGVPPHVRRQAPARRAGARARPSSRSSSTRRTSGRRWCTRTSSRCSTSARSATSTSWRRSTSSGRDLGPAGGAIDRAAAARRCRHHGRAVRGGRDAARARVRAQQAGRRRPADGHRPPRRLAQQHPGVGARRGEAVRLRHRQGRGARHEDPARRRQGQRQLHVARAGARHHRRRARGPVLAGAGDLLLPDRGDPVSGRRPPTSCWSRRRPGPGSRGAGAHRRPARPVRGHRAQGAGGRSDQALSERGRVRARRWRPTSAAARREAARYEPSCSRRTSAPRRPASRPRSPSERGLDARNTRDYQNQRS